MNPDEVHAFISENYEGIAKFKKAQDARDDATLLMIVSCEDYDKGLQYEFNPALFYQDSDALCRLLKDMRSGIDHCLDYYSQEENWP